jgi:structure-specific recognition protein 1
MLEKPQGSGGEAKFFYFVICLEKPVRQGQQKYSYLVWQTHDEDTVITMNMDQEKISEKYPDSGLKQSMESALHKLIGKVFKALTGKVVYAGSRKFKSSEGNQCVSCHFKQHTGVLYPNEKSFVFLHQPTLVIEYSDVDYVEFVKTSETRNFDMCVQLKAGKGPPGEAGKKLKFGAIEKKQFSAIAEFVKDKEAYFSVKSYEPEAADEDFEEDEDDDDFKSGDESAGSGDDDDDDDDEEDGVEDEVESKPLVKAETQKRKVPEGSKAPKSQPKEKEVVSKASPKKKKKDANAPLGARSAYMLWSNATRTDIKAEKPEMTFTEINQELGVKWKELDDASKAAWQTKADEDKRRHALQMEDYVPPEGASDEESGNKSKLKKKRKTKDPNAPKMPQTSFFLFMNQERSKVKAENPTATSGELGKLLGIAWKALSKWLVPIASPFVRESSN